MTNGDKVKLRAELAGMAMQGVISGNLDSAIHAARQSGMSVEDTVAKISKTYADALMKALVLDGE